MSTLYASFVDSSHAEKAAGALLDHGARAVDLSILANERTASGQPVPITDDAIHAEQSAKTGLSTTTATDVAIGTVKGATVGMSVGALAALAAMFIPGVGLVVGAGALATAMMGAAGTALAGAAAGGVAGLLSDQGVPDDVVTQYSSTFAEGGAILELAVPSGNLSAEEAEGVLAKYGAQNIATVNAARVRSESVSIPPGQPLVVESENPGIAPIAFAAPLAPGIQASTIVPNADVVVDAATGALHQTVGRATVVNEQPAIVTDPVTGEQHSATIVEEQRAVMTQPATFDQEGHVVVPLDGPQDTTIVREKHVEIDE